MRAIGSSRWSPGRRLRGNATDLDLAFRYENGKFKTIVGPNAVRVTVTGISPRFGLIVGTAGPNGGFVATCQ